MTTTPTLWKSLGKVNTGDVGPTGDFQFDPVVTALANGNILIAYTDDSNSVDGSNGNDIMGRLYDPEGNPITASFMLNSIAAVDNEGDPEIAALSDGGFVLVYEDIDANGTRLLWQKHNAAGGIVDQDVLQADPGGDEVVSDPKVAVFSDNSFVVVYTRTTNSGADTDVRARIVESDGTVGSEITIRAHPDDPREHSVAVLENDTFVVAYVEDDGGAEGIEYKIYDSSGAVVRNVVNIASPGTENEDPQVVALKGGGFVIAWSDETDFMDENIYARVYDSSGDDISGLIDIATDADDDAEPAVAALEDGGFVVLYDDDGTEAIRGQRFASLGTAVGGVFTLEQSGQLVNTPEAAALSDGRIIGTWQIFDTIGNDFDVSAEIWDPRDSVIVGSSAGDVLTGRQEASSIYGLGGGDTIFGVSGNDRIVAGSGMDSVFGGSGNDTIVDDDLLSGDTHDGGSGQDWIDFSPDTFGSFVAIDLQAGIATFSGGNADLILNFEHAIAGRDAQLHGNSAANTLIGSVIGDNSIDGRGGDDWLYGVGGSNDMHGDSGADRIYGGSHNDRARGGSGSDRMIGGEGDDSLYGGSGFDRVYGTTGNDLIRGGELSDTLFGGEGDDTAVGGSGSDRIFGGEGDDRQYAYTGDDTLLGDSGADSLFGGSGNDSFFINSGEQQAGETYHGGPQADTVLFTSAVEALEESAFFSIELARFFGTNGDDDIRGPDFAFRNDAFGANGDDDIRLGSGNDRLYGGNDDDALRGDSGSDTAQGGQGDDTLFGGEGDDALLGGSGRDRMVGGSGDDTLFGGTGSDRLNGASGSDTAFGGRINDTFIVDTAADLVLETAAGGIEDVIRSDASAYTLIGGAEGFAERVNLNGTAGDGRLIGNEHDNTLLGNSFDNVLRGNSGSDILNASKGGTNTMTGGSGDDTFVVASATDLVREFAGQGSDLVRALSDYTLPSGTSTGFVEDLRMQGGAGNIDGGGNELDNTIVGNSGDNRLAGFQGADRIEGGDGDDTLFGGGQGDRLEGESGNDILNVGKDDAAFGGSGSDSFLFSSSNLNNGTQVIRDFDGASLNAGNGEDKIVLATGLETGSFAYIGSLAFSGGGNSEARFTSTGTVRVDQDGDGSSDLVFFVNGLTAANQLTGTDFVWL